MKKFLLIVAVAMFSLGTYAQDLLWNSSISAVDANAQCLAISAVDNNGNVYVAGSQNQNFKFAGKDVETLAIGAYIAKYDAKGAEQYAIALQGGITITAMTTDVDGNLYVAGSFADEAYITDIEGTAGEYVKIKSDEKDSQVAAFLAKYDAKGNLLAVKSYKADVNADAYELTTVSIKKIVAEGTKVFVQFDYTGNVTIEETLSLVAKPVVLDLGGFLMTMLTTSSSVISFDSNFVNPVEVAKLAVADNANSSSAINSIDFIVEGENVYIAALVLGDVVLKTSDKSETFNFAVTEDGSAERGAILSNVGVKNVKFSNIPNSALANFSILSGMEIINGDLYIVGTFNGTCAFDNEKVAVSASDVFVASVNAETFAVNSVYTNANDEGDKTKFYEDVKGVVFGTESIFVIDEIADMNHKVAPSYKNYNVAYDGAVNVAATPLVATSVSYNKNSVALINCTNAASISVYSADNYTAIENVVAETENDAIYDLTGRRVNEITNAGIYIIGGKKVFVK